jgi:hypothetical protein
MRDLARLKQYIYVTFMWGMGGAEAWDRRMGSLTQLVCTAATLVIV